MFNSASKLDKIIDRLSKRHIETQTRGYVSMGTRFKVFHTPGTPSDVWEKIDDAALVNRVTGVPAGW
jgi:L-rhamnose isomerase/sugar isomerase